MAKKIEQRRGFDANVNWHVGDGLVLQQQDKAKVS